MAYPKDTYTDEEFWKQNPYPDSPNSDIYDINSTPYEQDEDGNWNKIRN